MTTITATVTLRPEYTCSRCHEPCGHLFQHGDEGLCLACELKEEEWKNRLIAEYEEREAAEGWGESPSLHKDGIAYYVDGTMPQADFDWSGLPAEVQAVGSVRLGDVTSAAV